jgi:hypothetical protein
MESVSMVIKTASGDISSRHDEDLRRVFGRLIINWI